MDIQTKDGILLRGIPDGTPDEVIKERIAQIRAGAKAPASSPAPPEPPSWLEQQLAKVPTGLVNNPAMTKARQFAMGAADPVVGAVQLGANVLPDSTGIPQKVNAAISEKDKALQAERGPDAGFDFTRAAGNLLSPANLAIAMKAPMAATTGMRALQGAGLGAVGGATTPVENVTPESGFFGPKALQIGSGALAGGLATPILGKVADAVTKRINMANFSPANAAADAEGVIANALKEVGQKIDDLPKVQLDTLRQQVREALSQGKTLDAAAALRKSDFDALGMKSTLGQITRDGTQFAKERNLRGVAGVGEDLMGAFTDQGKQLGRLVAEYGGKEAQSAVDAGRTIAAPLVAVDAQSQGKANVLYRGFRELAPDVKVEDPARFSNGLLKTLEDKQVGSFLSSDWHNRLNAITKGEFPLTPSTLEQMYQNANAQLRGAQGSAKTALAEVKGAIDGEMKRMAESSPAMDTARQSLALGRKEVAGRYGLREALPAVEAAAEGSVPADTFVKKFVLDAPTDQAKKLAVLLRKESPEAFTEARKQVAADIERAAFGTNPAGDNAFLPKQYADTLRRYGDEKLGIYFKPDELQQMKTIGRVGAYTNSIPNASPVNHSNSGSAIGNLLSKGAGAAMEIVPGGKYVKGAADLVKSTVDGRDFENAALAAAVPVKSAGALTPEQRALIAKLLGVSAGGTGLAAAPGFPAQ